MSFKTIEDIRLEIYIIALSFLFSTTNSKLMCECAGLKDKKEA